VIGSPAYSRRDYVERTETQNNHMLHKRNYDNMHLLTSPT